MIHEILIGEHQGLEPILPHQREKPFGADLRGLDLRLHVADDEVGGANIVAQHVPDGVVGPPLLENLDRLELEPFGIGVDGVDDAGAAGRQRADIEMMRGRYGKADQFAVEKDRHAKGDVRPM